MGWSGRAPGPCQHAGWQEAPSERSTPCRTGAVQRNDAMCHVWTYMDPARLQRCSACWDQGPQLLTYIRLPDAAYVGAASLDGFSPASTSMAPRHWPKPCRSTHQVREATG